VATNLAVDQLRRRKLHLQFMHGERQQSEDGEAPDINGSAASPEHILGAREKLGLIMAAVDELPVNVRQAFLLHRRNGLSYGEIADAMQVSVSSVEKYILQALQHCRKRLAALYPPGENG
jgi:RNA polymerase sigma-70 factor (ECF subfamily)|tara:strand:- start:4783 stop:5142 length:360 start_codon:yes stop_codon:yes gene_type:complete